MGGMEALPGDPTSLERWSHSYGRIAESLAAATLGLRAVANDDVFISRAIDQVRADAEQAATIAAVIHIRYSGTITALITYAGELRDAQNEANNAIARYHSADVDQQDALARKDYAEEMSRTPGPEQVEWLQRMQVAERDLENLRHASDNAWSIYRDALERRDAAARRAMDAIEDSQVRANINDTVWDNVSGVARNYYEFMQSLAPIIISMRDALETISSALSVCSLFLVALAPIPGVGEAALIVAGALSKVGLALDGLALIMTFGLMMYGKQSYRDLLEHAINFALDFGPPKALTQGLLSLSTKVVGLPSSAAESAMRYKFVSDSGKLADSATGAIDDLDKAIASLIPGDDVTFELFPAGEVWNAPPVASIPHFVLADYMPETAVDSALMNTRASVEAGALPITVIGTPSW
jgi:hypothetical protein